jgi:hypothetical protein
MLGAGFYGSDRGSSLTDLIKAVFFCANRGLLSQAKTKISVIF